MPHLQGLSRDTVVQFPACFDEYIAPDNPVRCIDAFVDLLDLRDLQFRRAVPKPNGRPSYAPADLLKLYLYGYLNRVRSSRLLERETQRNVEVMWLLKKLQPDFKTIADFRKDNLEPLTQVCRAFTLLCKDLDLFGAELIAVDGSKFKAVNNYERTFTTKRLERLLAEVDEEITRYLAELQLHDAQLPERNASQADLTDKLVGLQARSARYVELQERLQASDQSQISLTDPDSRSMVDHHRTIVGYNVQFATDSKHNLIVAHEVTNAVTDQGQLSGIARKAQAILDSAHLDVLADCGYYDGDQIKACLDVNMTPWVPKPYTSRSKKAGLFTKADFQYERESDTYRCPTGATLTYRFTTVEAGRPTRYYVTPGCRRCELFTKCTTNQRGRRITRWEHEGVLDEMQVRMKRNRPKFRRRRSIVEHPFGTMKCGMQQAGFLMRGKEKVSAEMSLTVLSYNFKRVITILSSEKLTEQLQNPHFKRKLRRIVSETRKTLETTQK